MLNRKERLADVSGKVQELEKKVAEIRNQNKAAVASEGKIQFEAEIMTSQLESQLETLKTLEMTLTDEVAQEEFPRTFGPNSAANRFIRATVAEENVRETLSAEEYETFVAPTNEANSFLVGVQSPEVRAAVSPHDATGAPLVPVRVATMSERQKYYGGVAQMASQEDAGREQIRHPIDSADDSLASAAAPKNITSVNSSSANAFTLGADRELGEVNFLPRVGSASRAITESQLRSSGFDIQRYVERDNMKKIGRAWDIVFSTSARGGNNDPRGGVINLCEEGVTTRASGAVNLEDFIDLAYSVDPSYWLYDNEGEWGSNTGEGRIGWVVSPLAHKALADLTVDPRSAASKTDIRRVWLTDIRTAIPRSLLGFPLVMGSFANPAANALTAAFGDWSAYKIYNFGPTSMKVVFDTKTARYDGVEVWNYTYRDAGVVSGIKTVSSALVTEAIKHMKVKA